MPEEFSYDPDKVQLADPDDIFIPERQRQSYSRKFIEGDLAPAIAEVGQLQPAICYLDEDNRLVLIAGENRRRACKHLGIQLKYVLKQDLSDPYSREAAELYENLCRNNLTWQEEDRAYAKLHRLREEQHGHARRGPGGQSLEATASEVKVSRRKLKRALEIEPFLNLPDVKNAKSRQEGHNKIKALIDSLERETKVEAALKDPQRAPSEQAIDTANKAIDRSTMDDAEAEQTLNMLAQYAERVKLGKFEEIVPTLPDEHFDIVIFDPPWGVDYDKVMYDSGSTTKYEDSAEKFVEDFPKFIRLLWEKMAPDSHLYLFFGITWHEFVYSTLEDVRTDLERDRDIPVFGFDTNRMPLFWHKRGSRRTRNPDIWPGRSYEAIAYARKGSKPLVLKGQPDIITTPQPSRKMKLSHPSGKHPDIMIDLLKRSAALGDKVLDPMCGSGMTGVACEFLKSLKLDWTLIDQEQEFVHLSLWNLGNGYYSIVDSKEDEEPQLSATEKAQLNYEEWKRNHPEQEKEPLPDDFRSLTPGSDEWKAYWKSHPDEQSNMLEFKKHVEARDRISDVGTG